MKRACWLALAVGVATTLCAAPAFPCGASFGSGVRIDPRQDIVVVHKDGVETYVFKPTFCGESSEFGLILPVPSRLTLPPLVGDPQAFDMLIELSAPKVERRTVCGYARPGSKSTGASGGASSSNDGTHVVASGRVGFLDWVQLEATDRSSFTAWLDANHYPYDERAQGTFDYYVEKHWYFLAFKIAQGDAGPGHTTCRELGPIQLSFASKVPVVPSRMAAAGMDEGGGGYDGQSYSWRIFGISAGENEIAFSPTSTGEKDKKFSGLIDAANAAKTGGLAQAGDRVTKLELGLEDGDREDVDLVLTPGKDYRETIYLDTYVQCDAGKVADSEPYVDGAADTRRVPADGAVHSAARDASHHSGAASGASGREAIDATRDRVEADSGSAAEDEADVGSGGCSTAGGLAGHGGFLTLALAALASLRRRRS